MADSNLKAEKFVEGLEKPTSMAFLGPDDIIVLEKNKGTVMRVVNGVILDEPLLDLNVAYRHERGLLGVAIANDDTMIKDGDRDNRKSSDHFNVYLYFTTGEINDGEDTGEVGVFRNSLYRYELVSNGSRLVNPKLLFELPRDNHSFHNGGALLVGPDNNIYVATGDLSQPYNSTVQNAKNGSSPSGTGGILRFTGDGGTAVGENGSILSDTSPLNRYYAYGIRKSLWIGL